MKILGLLFAVVFASQETLARDFESLIPWTTEFIENAAKNGTAVGLDFDKYLVTGMDSENLIVEERPPKAAFQNLALFNYKTNALEVLAQCFPAKKDLLAPFEVAVNGRLVVIRGKTATTGQRAIGVISRDTKKCISTYATSENWVGPRTIGNVTYFIDNDSRVLSAVNPTNSTLSKVADLSAKVTDFDGVADQVYLMSSGYFDLVKVTKLDLNTKSFQPINLPDFQGWKSGNRYFHQIQTHGTKLAMFSYGSSGKYSGIPGYYIVDLENIEKSFWAVTTWSNFENTDYFYFDFTGETINEFVPPGRRPTYDKRFPIYVNHLQATLVSKAKSLALNPEAYWGGFQISNAGIFQLTAQDTQVYLTLTDFSGKELKRVPSIKINRPTNVWMKAADGKIIVRDYNYPVQISIHDQKTLNVISSVSLYETYVDVTTLGNKLYLSPDAGKPGTISVFDFSGKPLNELNFEFPRDVKGETTNAMNHHSSIVIRDGIAYVGMVSDNVQRAYLIIQNLTSGAQRTFTADCGFRYCISLDSHTVPNVYLLGNRAFLSFNPELVEFDLQTGASKFISMGTGAYQMSAFNNALWIGHAPQSRNFGAGDATLSVYTK